MSSAETALNINNQKYINTSNKKIDSRWNSLERLYSPQDVQKLRGTVNIEYSLARQGAEKLWKYLNEDDFVQTFVVLTGNQSVQNAKAGLKALYISGWHQGRIEPFKIIGPVGIRDFFETQLQAFQEELEGRKNWEARPNKLGLDYVILEIDKNYTENKNFYFISASHNGYEKKFGYIHTRSMKVFGLG